MSTSRATSSLASTVQRNVRSARKQAGKTQRQVADLVGVETMAVSRWERGTQRPKNQHLEVLAEKLGLPPGWFFIDRCVEPDEQAA